MSTVELSLYSLFKLVKWLVWRVNDAIKALKGVDVLSVLFHRQSPATTAEPKAVAIQKSAPEPGTSPRSTIMLRAFTVERPLMNKKAIQTKRSVEFQCISPNNVFRLAKPSRRCRAVKCSPAYVSRNVAQRDARETIEKVAEDRNPATSRQHAWGSSRCSLCPYASPPSMLACRPKYPADARR